MDLRHEENGPDRCRLKGARKEKAAERRTATVAQVDALANVVGMRWRLMVYLGAYGLMRPEELAGLRRRDVDIDTLRVRIRIRLAEPERMNGRRGYLSAKHLRAEGGRRLRSSACRRASGSTISGTRVTRCRRAPGGTLKDTMARAGQSSDKAALICQYSDAERPGEVAAGLGATVHKARDADRAQKEPDKPSGANLASEADRDGQQKGPGL